MSHNNNIIHSNVSVASVFASPVMLNKTATVEKACKLIREAAQNGARLVVFPESFIPGFPVWTAFNKPIDGHEIFRKFALNSMSIPGPEFRLLSETAAAHKIFVSMGFSEVSTISSGCLWNSNILIGDDGSLLNHHRKIMPTFYEKLVWASGDGAGLKVCKTAIGRIGSLICGENNNTLARYSMISQGEQIHTACFPSIWPFRNPLNHDVSYNLEKANKIRVSAHCFEGKVFSIVSSSFLDNDAIEIIANGNEENQKILKSTPRANSIIIGPEGDVIAESSTDKETIIYGDLDLERAIELKQHHDLAGYYNRFDIFSFSLNQKRLEPVNIYNEKLMPELQRHENDDLYINETMNENVVA